ncbi:MAG: hypothetical protein EAZ99_17485 [Alphaproteobacteria bacterium]|nr:hypothetical protein [Alphaproteobacteria bacterium]TAD87461.1 MAG: hypothetical protein EAZ99_17485 [Alphaproteobacteria bacterium]
MRGAVAVGAMIVATAAALAQSSPNPQVRRCPPGAGPECLSVADNTNRIDLTRRGPPPTTCSAAEFRRRFRRAPCPGDMAWVCDAELGVSVCVDRSLRADPQGRPLGGQSRETCAAWCATRARRLPTNHEYLVGCADTPVRACLQPGLNHPVLARLAERRPWQVGDTDCRSGDEAWRRACMNDLSLNDRLATRRPHCVASNGLRDMAGVLGQWVADDVPRPGRSSAGQFNGGFWAQPASSCAYTTVAHPPDWSDYSIGCRCAQDAEPRPASPRR